MENKKETNGFTKYDNGKLRYDLLPPAPLADVVKVLTFGAQKYAPNNFIKSLSVMRYFAACLRHLFEWASGVDKDEETGVNPLAHSICCLIFILEILRVNPKADDRYDPNKILNGDSDVQS